MSRATRRGDGRALKWLAEKLPATLLRIPEDRWSPEQRRVPAVMDILASRDWIVVVADVADHLGQVRSLTIQAQLGRPARSVHMLNADKLRQLRQEAGLGQWTLVDVVLADTEADPGANTAQRVVYLVPPGALTFVPSLVAKGVEAELG